MKADWLCIVFPNITTQLIETGFCNYDCGPLSNIKEDLIQFFDPADIDF